MSDTEWYIKIDLNGRRVLDGNIEELHGLKEGKVKHWKFDVKGSLDIRIERMNTYEDAVT